MLFACSQADKPSIYYRDYPVTFLIIMTRPDTRRVVSPLSCWIDFGDIGSSSRRRVDHELRSLLSVVTVLRLDCVSSSNQSVTDMVTAGAVNGGSLVAATVTHKFMKTGIYEVCNSNSCSPYSMCAVA